MFTDLIIAIVFTGIVAAVLCLNENKIQEWAESKHGRKLEWRD